MRGGLGQEDGKAAPLKGGPPFALQNKMIKMMISRINPPIPIYITASSSPFRHSNRFGGEAVPTVSVA
jgi:hypothetical protein